jgi:hypothetical protein
VCALAAFGRSRGAAGRISAAIDAGTFRAQVFAPASAAVTATLEHSNERARGGWRKP